MHATPPGITRGQFLRYVSAFAATSLIGCDLSDPSGPAGDAAILHARPAAPTQSASVGVQPLGLGAGRDGFLYVPPTYSPGQAAPLVVLLHGAGGSAKFWSDGPLSTIFDLGGIVVIGPDSRATSWDLMRGAFGPDVEFIDAALAFAFRRCNIDPTRIAVAGFSDGASYALSLGITNGDLFTALLGFSPGFIQSPGARGKPRIFIEHGTQDTVLPVEGTRTIVSRLIADGYDVSFKEFAGPHTVTTDEVIEGMRWFVPVAAPIAR